MGEVVFGLHGHRHMISNFYKLYATPPNKTSTKSVMNILRARLMDFIGYKTSI